MPRESTFLKTANVIGRRDGTPDFVFHISDYVFEGANLVRHLSAGVEIRLGYNHVIGGIDRITPWMHKDSLIGRVVKFSHQPSGAKEAPRFPKFIGFRETWDMSA
jgi:hypothetical protein